ncbi:MAG: O-antigen polymerase [Bacteroidota bacterium]
MTFYAIVPTLVLSNIFPLIIPLLAKLTIISTIFVILGLNVGTSKRLKSRLLGVGFTNLIIGTFIVFFLMVFLIMVTAPNIPLIESLKGATEEELSIHRESFLKGRTGWESSLGYLIESINGAFLPFLIAYSFLINHKYKNIFALFFLLYCISFLAKSYFLRLAIPLFFVYFSKADNKPLYILKGGAVIAGMIFLMYSFAGSKGLEVTNDEVFFSTLYLPQSMLEGIMWRSFVIPVMVAVDALILFTGDLKSNFMMGDTSSFIAFIKGSERINFERMVYQSQFGGSETGNANSYYVIEAYVNFGLTGVMLFSFMIGRIMRFLIRKENVALTAMIPMFLLNLFSTGLISLLLSGGYLAFILFLMFVKIKQPTQLE